MRIHRLHRFSGFSFPKFLLEIGAICVICGPLFAEDVKVWQEDLSLRSYPAPAPDPLPHFTEQVGRPVYPYSMMHLEGESSGEKPAAKVWHAVFLENEYLKIAVLPDLGGRLYSIYDKLTSREVLYRNHVVKYGDVGVRGAWTAGGLEWNFPDGHANTAISPVDFTTRQERDGSATITVGDTERIQGLQWMVTIRLRPGVRAVETEIVLRNPGDIPGRYWFWANAAIPARDDLRFVYPMRLVRKHSGAVQAFPVDQGVDYSYWRNSGAGASWFALDSWRDFFGAYYERSDNGVVQVADHRLLPGKKIYSWGISKAADREIASLTDTDGPYAEMQAGRPIQQNEHLVMEPHHTERIVEYWYPVERLGGAWSEANRDAVLRLAVTPGKVHVWVEANRAFDATDVVLQNGTGITLQSWKTALSPGVPFSAVADVAGGGPFVASVKNTSGPEIIRYRSDQPVDGNDHFRGMPAAEKSANAPIQAAMQPYEEGQRLDNESLDVEARAKWETAISLNPLYAPAHLSLGISYLRTGQYQQAETHLREALRLAPDQEGARYYLGLLLRAIAHTETDRVEARALLVQAATKPDWAGPAHILLGEMALAAGEWTAAIAQLSASSESQARVLLALAYRAGGNTVRAKTLLSQLRIDLPVDHLVLHEAALGGDGEADSELWRLLDRQSDQVLCLALNYAAVKSPEARKVLERAIARAGKSRVTADPMWHYALGWLIEKGGEAGGDAAGGLRQFKLAARLNVPYVFPSRVAEIEILNHALAALSADLPDSSVEASRTAYYLGEALAGQHRWTEAHMNWMKAAALNPKDAAPDALLAMAASVAGDPATTLAEYSKAVAADPSDERFYLLRDDLLAKDSAATVQRLAFFDAAPEAVKQREPVIMRLVPLYAAAGRLPAAQDLLRQMPPPVSPESVEWRRQTEAALADALLKAGRGAEAAAAMVRSTAPGEAGNAGDIPPKRCLELAASLERGKKHDEAMQWVERAADWPKNSTAVPKPTPSLDDLYNRAMALARVRRFPEAKADMEQVAAADRGGNLGHEAEMTLRHWKAAGVIQ